MRDGRRDELSLVVVAKEEEKQQQQQQNDDEEQDKEEKEDIFPLQNLKQDECEGIEPETIEGSPTIHVTRSLSQIIRHWLGGPVVMVFPMLELGERYHLACLNILHAMMASSSSALSLFEKDHGWEVLAYLLNESKQSLTTATFDCIVDLIAGGQTSTRVIEEQLRSKSSRERRRLSIRRHEGTSESTRAFSRSRGLKMLMDLLRSANGNRHYVLHSLGEILRLLAELLVSAENQLMWRFCVGLEGTLDLLVAISNQRHQAESSLTTLLEIPTTGTNTKTTTNRSYSDETALQLREPLLQILRLDLIQRRRPLGELQQSSRLILGTSKGSDEDKVPSLIDFIIFEAQRIHARKIVDDESLLLLNVAENEEETQQKDLDHQASIGTDCLNGALRVIVEVAIHDGFSSSSPTTGKNVERLPPLGAALLVAGDWYFPLALLRSESESVRVSALHLIALMLDEVADAGQGSFRWAWRQNQLVPPPSHYLVAVKESLKHHTATASTMEALLDLLFGSSKTRGEDDDAKGTKNDDENKEDEKIENEDEEDDDIPRTWIRTEWLEVILGVLSTSSNMSIELQRRVCSNVGVLLFFTSLSLSLPLYNNTHT